MSSKPKAELELALNSYLSNRSPENIAASANSNRMFLSPAVVVHFTFVSAGQSTRIDEFRTRLRLYRGLYRQLEEVRMAFFIHQDSFHIPEAESCFRATLQAPSGPHFESSGLVRYFELRWAWEQRKYEKVGSEELIYLNGARRKYAGVRYESMYQEWLNRTPTSTNIIETPKEHDAWLEFLPYQVNIDPRTFMATNTSLTGDKPSGNCFHPSRHSRCHGPACTINEESDA